MEEGSRMLWRFHSSSALCLFKCHGKSLRHPYIFQSQSALPKTELNLKKKFFYIKCWFKSLETFTSVEIYNYTFN